MALSLQTIETGIKKVPASILIHGPNGVGKSFFSSQFPSPIFLDLEGNINHLNTARQRIKKWSEVSEFLSLLLKEKHDYKTLVIDTLDQLELLAKPIACKAVGIQNINEGYARGLAELCSMFQGVRESLESLTLTRKMHLVLIAHSKQKLIQPLGRDSYHQNIPSLTERVYPLFTDWCNVVGHAHLLTKTEKIIEAGFNQTKKLAEIQEDSDLGSRVLEVEPSCTYLAKNTFNFSTKDGKIKLCAKEMLTHIKTFYEQSTKEGK